MWWLLFSSILSLLPLTGDEVELMKRRRLKEKRCNLCNRCGCTGLTKCCGTRLLHCKCPFFFYTNGYVFRLSRIESFYFLVETRPSIYLFIIFNDPFYKLNVKVGDRNSPRPLHGVHHFLRPFFRKSLGPLFSSLCHVAHTRLVQRLFSFLRMSTANVFRHAMQFPQYTQYTRHAKWHLSPVAFLLFFFYRYAVWLAFPRL